MYVRLPLLGRIKSSIGKNEGKAPRYAKMEGAKEGVGERAREKESNKVRDTGRRRREGDLSQYPDLSLLFQGNSINLLTPFI